MFDYGSLASPWFLVQSFINRGSIEPEIGKPKNPYIQRRQILLNVEHILNGVPNSSDDPIDDMHHSVSGHLVPMYDPGTVNSNHLNTRGEPKRLHTL